MTTGIPLAQNFYRGQTLQFNATFTDFNKNVTQPPSATLIVWYEGETSGPDQELTVPMTAPISPSVVWTALLDTRNFQAPRTVMWSVHSNGVAPLPVAVQDGSFTLSANQANQPTF